MKITEWLDGFLIRHMARHPRTDWPDPDTQAWTRFHRTWLDTMLALQPRPNEAEADRASLAVHGDAIAWVQDHASVVSDAIRKARTSNLPSKPDDASKATPEALSRDCEFCSGSGHATIYQGDLIRSAHCVCPMGRWMRGRTSLDLQRRIYDLHAILSGETIGWSTDDPGLVGVSVPQSDPSGWRDLAIALVERTKP